MKFTNSRSLIASMAMVMACACALPARAQDGYPNRPIRMVLGFAAGGGTDVIARALANKMGEILKQPVIIDNKSGANGNIAAETVAKAPSDGYTLLYNTSGVAISPGLYSKLGYDISKDLAPVSLTANLPLILVVAKRLNVESAQQFVDLLKTKPGAHNYGSAGNGNITHLAALLFLQATETTATHVPYRSEAPAVADLASGQVDFYLGTAPGVIPMIKGGRIRALAVSALKRMDSMPELPTLSETVANGLELGAWSGIMAPAGTSPDIINKINAAVAEAIKDKALINAFAAQGAEPKHNTPAQYGDFMQTELKRWNQVIRANHVSID